MNHQSRTIFDASLLLPAVQRKRETIIRRVNRLKASGADAKDVHNQLISEFLQQIGADVLPTTPPLTSFCFSPPSLSSKNPPRRTSIMISDENAIMCKFQLVPGVPMPFSIVCTLAGEVSDENNILQKRLTIRVPTWDEADIPLYKASLTESGHGIVLTMPATVSWLRNLAFVDDLTQCACQDHPSGLLQVAQRHTAFCNQFLLEPRAPDTIKVLLLFESGQTFNNRSFNIEVPATDFLSLQKKECAIEEDPTAYRPHVAMRSAVIFDAAMDEEGAESERNV